MYVHVTTIHDWVGFRLTQRFTPDIDTAPATHFFEANHGEEQQVWAEKEGQGR